MRISSKATAVITIVLVVSVFAVHTAAPAMVRLTGGFMAYYVGGQTLRLDVPAKRLYDDHWFSAQVLEVSHGSVTDVYLANPPSLAVVCLPFAYLNVNAARQLWVALSVVCLAISLGLICAQFRWMSRPWRVAAMSALLFLAAPTREQTSVGQIYASLLLLHVVGWRAYIRGKNSLAGIALGLALALKLSGWPIGFLMLAQRRWMAALWAFATATAVSLASLPWVGLAAWRAFLFDAIPRMLRSPAAALTAYQDTTSFWQHLFRYDASLNPQPVFDFPALATVLSLGTMVAACFALVSRPRPASVSFAAAVALTELLSPVAEQYHYVLLLLPLALLWQQVSLSRNTTLAGCALVATLLIGWPIDYKSVHPVWAVLHNYPRLIGGWIMFAALLYTDRVPLDRRAIRSQGQLVASDAR
jgi:Glycosyltransferase family 87